MAVDLMTPRIMAAIEYWTDPTIRRILGFRWLPDSEGTYFLRTSGTHVICYEYSQEEVNFIKAHLLVAHALT